ncbi:hypothetical protein [Streptomyces sp. SP18CM02]|uniref:hypothetical protein n=1 Tax=Streptomyces sp. SP18CM02 TaxID=2758571 RepID=UPI00168BABD0|nr:hypothetical protein [Streptomyces sp. SP18CM02]MBD3550917.1 hypothetical protein [Streptomyces sp. SP18CM02]
MTTDRNLRAGLTAASARLKEVNSPELAAFIDTALSVGVFRVRESEVSDNLAIRLPESARDAIEDAADDMGVTSLGTVVDEGFRRFLAGEFTVAGRTYERRGTAGKKVNLNVRPAALLREQVAATGTSPMHVAADYLMKVFRTGPYADNYEGAALKPGQARIPQVPRLIREQIREAADGRASMDIEEGFAKLLAGEIDPVAPVWADTSDMVPFKVRPNDDLFNRAKDRLKDVKGVTPMHVGIAYLLDKYGIDPATS